MMNYLNLHLPVANKFSQEQPDKSTILRIHQQIIIIAPVVCLWTHCHRKSISRISTSFKTMLFVHALVLWTKGIHHKCILWPSLAVINHITSPVLCQAYVYYYYYNNYYYHYYYHYTTLERDILCPYFTKVIILSLPCYRQARLFVCDYVQKNYTYFNNHDLPFLEVCFQFLKKEVRLL